MRSPIVIAGAGIGGLTAALALAARGIDCLILEKAPVLAAVGAGVQLSPNASHILIRLGLRDELARFAIQPASVSLNSVRAGGQIVRLPLKQDVRAPYWVIHRADLQTALLRTIAAHPRVTLRLGADVTGFEHHADGIGVMAGGEMIEAAALIAADGVRSAIRQQLCPGAAALPAGRAAWRGLARRNASAADTDVQLWMGPRAHLVAYPVLGGEQTNLVITLPDGASEPSERPGPDVAAQLRQAGWSRTVSDLVVTVDRLVRYELLTAPDMAAWNRDRIALIGDAAHAMLPFAAQGAAMAIEDAAVLAHSIGDGDSDIAAALARYAQQRKSRVSRVVAAARQSGLIYHLRGPMAAARDATIRALGARRLLQRQDWIYDWRI